MMYGKHFSSLYEGSMIGAGSHVFAVWGYVIAKQVPDRKEGSWVELNPKLLHYVIGDTEARMEEAIAYLCSPDPKTRTPGDDGRRLVSLGGFAYRVVNGAKYHAIRNEEARRTQNREAQRKHRAKDKPITPEQQEKLTAAHGEVQRSVRALGTLERQIQSSQADVPTPESAAPDSEAR